MRTRGTGQLPDIHERSGIGLNLLLYVNNLALFVGGIGLFITGLGMYRGREGLVEEG